MSFNHILQILILPPYWVSLPIAALFAFVTGAARLVTPRGAIAVFAIGAIIFGFGGGLFAIPLLTFFFTSSLLSRIGRSQKSKLKVNVEKGAIRDVWQVLANGSAAAAMVLLFHLVVHRWGFDASRSVLMLYLSALAAVNSDTWATEIGRMSRQTPRSLATWKPVESGTSGAITLWGTVAAVLGSIVIPLSLLSFWGLTPPEFICVTWAGFLGSFLDSILGASLQAHYRDPQTGSLTEMREINGRRTKLVRGLAWMNNDTVNLMAGVGGILCAWVLLKYCVTPFH